MKPGDVLDIWDGGKLMTVIYLGSEKMRHKVLTGAGRSMRILGSRIACVAAASGAASLPPEELAARARAFEADAERLSTEVDLASLWEIVVDDGESFTLDDLSGLAWAETGPAERSALLRALVASSRYFTRKHMDFVPRSREELEQYDRQERAQEEKGRRREVFLDAARQALADGGDGAGTWPQGSEKLLEAIQDVAVNGVASTRLKEAMPLLKELGYDTRQNPEQGSFELLVKLGVLSRDENLLLLRHGVRRDFPAEVLEAANELARTVVKAELPRRDLRHLRMYAIDDSETTEVDDAVSIEPGPDPDSFRFGIHIADPTALIPLGSLVDEEAFRRATTFYLPDERLMMLPAVLSEQAGSLLEGAERPVLSFFAVLDAEGRVRDFELCESLIRVTKRLTYEAADVLIAAGGGAPGLGDDIGDLTPSRALLEPSAGAEPMAGELALMARIARQIVERRVERGAVVLKGPDLEVKLRGGEVQFRRLEPWTPSWVLVSEAMVLANGLGASLLERNGTPAIYRRQSPPDSPVKAPRSYEPAAFAAARRQMKPSEIGLEPGPHAGLGLPVYAQLSSPLRRYQDFAQHRQLRALVRGEKPPYDKEAMWRVAATTDQAEKVARECERGRREFWLLKHLETLPPDTRLGAVITRPEERRTFVELEDYLYVTVLPPVTGHKPGRRLEVVIEAVEPRAGRLVVRELPTS